jgi:23S rRNA (pseudouridine1915-N3)-methyltransferase
MMGITLICVGTLKETFYTQACAEFIKRLGGYCAFDVTELPEARLPDNASQKETDAALKVEGQTILSRIPKNSAVAALCVEGDALDSVRLSDFLQNQALTGKKLCFVVGGSHGLHADVKARADFRFSMSRMTFPHNLARVMLLEQLYRGFKIAEGAKYHT